ncbi:putative FMN/FAD exporter YeeO [Thalassocella blandensis]|nr:putative FMN/FAD exporter YeeO [Thalassocella blandensis]
MDNSLNHCNARHGTLKEFLHIAWPSVIVSILNSLVGISDILMVSSLGASAIAAVGLATKFLWILLLFVVGVASAGRVLISQYFGANDIAGVKQTLVLGIAILLALLLPFFVLFSVSPHSWLAYLTDDTQIQLLTAQYLKITASTVFIIAITISFDFALRAVGHTKLPLVLGTVVAASNIALNYVLIFGKFGAPELGAVGAAWGTLLARLIHLTLLCVVIFSSDHILAPHLKELSVLAQFKKVQAFFLYSLPVGLTFLLFSAGNSLYHIIAAKLGTPALTVMSILEPIQVLVIAIFIGISEAGSILVARALGSNNFSQAKQLKGELIRYTTFGAMIIGVLLWLTQTPVLVFFDQLDSETHALMINTYTILCALVWLKIHNMVAFESILRAGGDNNWCLKTDVICMWVIGLPITAFVGLILHWPFEYVYAATFVEEIAKMLASQSRMTKPHWVKNLTSVLSAKSTST